VIAGLLGAVVLTGCDLRLETPARATPTLDAAQQARQAAAIAAADLADAGVAALASAAAAPVAQPGDPAATAAWLQRVVEASTEQLTALGGVWVPFPSASPAPTPAASSAPSPAAVTVADVVARLVTSSDVAAASADGTSDPDLARLLASVAVGRALLAERLAAAAGLEPPVVAATGAELTAVPAGVAASDLADLIASQDALGYAWEVEAARVDEPARDVAAARAAAHRTAAATWAGLADVAGTGLDPRRAAYDLPDALLDPAVDDATRLAALATLEDALADVYTGLVAQAEPGARAPLLAALATAARTAADLTGQVPALPGTIEPAA
jgi:hypothetical protein